MTEEQEIDVERGVNYPLYACLRCHTFQFPDFDSAHAFQRITGRDSRPVESRGDEAEIELGVHECPGGGPSVMQRYMLTEFSGDTEYELGDPELESAVVLVQDAGVATTITTVNVQDKDCVRLARILRAELAKMERESGQLSPAGADSESEDGVSVVVRGRRVAVTVSTELPSRSLVAVVNLVLGTVIRTERRWAVDAHVGGPKA